MFALKTLVSSVAFAAASMVATSANAYVFDSVNDSVTVNFLGAIPGATLAASITYTLTAFNSANDTATLSVLVNNTSSGDGVNRIVSFGVINTAPELSGITDDSTVFATLINQNYPGGVQNVEFCGFSGQNCSGGSNTGLLENASDLFNITLSFVDDILPFTFTGYSARWQSAGTNADSFVLVGCERGDPNCDEVPPEEIPEPGTIALLGLALLAAARSTRKKV